MAELELIPVGSSVGVILPVSYWGLLERAIARPSNAANDGEPDLAEPAALCALGIASNQGFIDGNRRTAYVALATFLALDGWCLPATDAEAVVAMPDIQTWRPAG